MKTTILAVAFLAMVSIPASADDEGVIAHDSAAMAEKAYSEAVTPKEKAAAREYVIETRKTETRAILEGHDNVGDFARWLHENPGP